jgi:hypothetical protein
MKRFVVLIASTILEGLIIGAIVSVVQESGAFDAAKISLVAALSLFSIGDTVIIGLSFLKAISGEPDDWL